MENTEQTLRTKLSKSLEVNKHRNDVAWKKIHDESIIADNILYSDWLKEWHITNRILFELDNILRND